MASDGAWDALSNEAVLKSVRGKCSDSAAKSVVKVSFSIIHKYFLVCLVLPSLLAEEKKGKRKLKRIEGDGW